MIPIDRSLLFARGQLRRHVRKLRDRPWLAFFQSVGALVGTVMVVGHVPLPIYGPSIGQPGAYAFGRALAAGGADGVVRRIRGVVAIAVVLTALLTALQVSGREGTWHVAADGVLTAAPVRVVVVGDLLRSIAFSALLFAPVGVAGSVALAAGAGTPALAAAGFAVTLLVLATGGVVGYALGTAVTVAFVRIPTVRDNKAQFGTPVAIGYFGLFFWSRRAGAALATLPLGWYGDLLLAPVRGTGPTAIGAVGVSALTVVGGIAVSVPLARAAWLSDPPAGAATDDAEDGTDDTALPVRVARRVLSRPTAAVTVAAWRRTVRAPQVLFFGAMPVVIVASLTGGLHHRAPAALPVLVAVHGGLAAGMGLTLNPLGNAGRTLPVTLSTPGGSGSLVRGYALSAALPAAPLVALAAIVAGAVTAAASPTLIALAGVLGAVVAISGAMISVAVGCWLPELDGLRPGNGDGGVMLPNFTAASVYAGGVALLGTPALGGALVGGAAAVAGGAVSVLALAVAAAWAYRYAVATVEGHEIGA